MWKVFILCLVAVATAHEATFQNYKVFRITPRTEAQLELLRQLEEASDEYSFWKEPSYVDQPFDVMVSPQKLPDFIEVLNSLQAEYEIFIDNVQTLIDNEKSPVQASGFDFKSYHTLAEIYEYLDELAAEFPKNVEVIVGGKTYEGRQIKGVKVSFGKTENPGIFIEGGIHAREWISPATVMFILDSLLRSSQKDVREMADRHDWYIFPVFNPDGYVHTHTKHRMWRKSRKPYTAFCVGADLNRNWGYKWNYPGGASDRPCEETYAGTSAFSDVETKTMAEYITSISDKFYAYLSFHSYSQLLLFPYGHTREHLGNYEESKAIGVKTIDALARRYGTQYVTGNIAETIYIATGSSVDWIKGTFGKPITYTYELRDRGRHGFFLPPEQIIPTGEETLDSLVGMFKEAAARGLPK